MAGPQTPATSATSNPVAYPHSSVTTNPADHLEPVYQPKNSDPTFFLLRPYAISTITDPVDSSSAVHPQPVVTTDLADPSNGDHFEPVNRPKNTDPTFFLLRPPAISAITDPANSSTASAAATTPIGVGKHPRTSSSCTHPAPRPLASHLPSCDRTQKLRSTSALFTPTSEPSAGFLLPPP